MPEKTKRVVKKCISFATKHGVKELELNFCDPKLDCYFTTTLINHELLNFHALKEISLGWMEVKLTTIKTLLSNCEALESLSLKRCWNSDDFDLGEENLRLRKLVVDKCMFRSDSRYFIVNAPNLRYFYYSGLNNNFLVIDVRSLVMEEEVLDFYIEFEGRALFLYKLMEDISSVSVLTVYNYLLQDYDFPDNFNVERFWTDHARAYGCLIYTLREVEIKGFKGTMIEICVLTYFITIGRVLRNMTINILKDGVSDQSERLESYCRDISEMLMSQRASRDLEISIC
ncbi:uncharacterized protein LOC130732812 [Lotus japonicus]|uniref:uncharacterized protein LOC130732812 n=1 Tax=Lotus japonicus TaxID=34305 RepID=UPI0025847276|nr:uncharacterized protein LOC130732812 [Lotus japonicus]